MFYRFGKCYPDSLLVLPGELGEKIDDASESEIRILLAIAPLLQNGSVEEEEAISFLGKKWEREEILSALAFWRGCGILKAEGKKSERKAPVPAEKKEEKAPCEKKVIDADEAPFYSSADLADAAEREPDFKNLVSFAEERLEKVMNTSELARLYSFLDYLKMPLDVVMLVIEDSASRGKKSLRYITKLLTVFQDDGIDTYEKAEAYFVSRKESQVYENVVRRLFGLGTRKLTKAEEECITTWRAKFGYGEEMLNAAYEKTVAAAKNPSIKYMHKILENWYASGATTPAEAAQKGSAHGEKAAKSYDVDDFFEQAVSKGRKKL